MSAAAAPSTTPTQRAAVGALGQLAGGSLLLLGVGAPAFLLFWAKLAKDGISDAPNADIVRLVLASSLLAVVLGIGLLRGSATARMGAIALTGLWVVLYLVYAERAVFVLLGALGLLVLLVLDAVLARLD